jgi:hypothetical protein
MIAKIQNSDKVCCMGDLILKHFDFLTGKGVKVIPLRPNSKIPLRPQWNKNWNRGDSRRWLQVYPQSNIGILLGDIVDVEGDSEEANQTVLKLIGDYPHPSYTSSKSIHHLFVTPDPNLRILRHKDIEFRGYGHQSVLPPSEHEGIKYRWKREFSFPIPVMPDSLINFYKEIQEKNATTGVKSAKKPFRQRVWCASCNRSQFLHRHRWKLEVEAFRLLHSKWECLKCRTIDLRPICRRLKGSKRRRNSAEGPQKPA